MINKIKIIIYKFIPEKLFLEICKFFIFSGLAALINIFFGLILYNVFNFYYYLSVAIAYFIGKIFNFFMSKFYIFPSGTRKSVQEFITYSTISCIGFFLTLLLTALFYNLSKKFIFLNLKTSKAISHILAVGFVGIYSFIGHKFFSFKKGLINTLKIKKTALNK